MSNHNLARLLKALTWIGAVLLLLMPSLAWLWRIDAWPGFRNAMPEQVSGDPVVLILLLLPFATVAWGLIQLSGFCSRLQRGEHFSRAASTALRRFGLALVVGAALLPLTRVLLRAYLHAGDSSIALAQGYLRALPILATAMGLILGLIVLVFAAILEQATALAEENARFI